MSGRSYSILCKPVGARCNLDCEYCYYLEKETLFCQPHSALMSADVLERFISGYININTYHTVEFVWQGGEPTLGGISFYEKVIALQKKHNNGKQITNILQTNGMLLTDEWCRFLFTHDFLVGISIDGSKEVHNLYRKDRAGNGTFDTVMRSIERLKKHNIMFNTLTVLHKGNIHDVKHVYSFLKTIGSGYMQFLPLVERYPTQYEKEEGQTLSKPPSAQDFGGKKVMLDACITPEQFGKFYIALFDLWYTSDVGSQYIQFFEAAIGNATGRPAGICVHEKTCGHAAALDYNGNLYSCDHFVYQDYLLGNIMNHSLYDLMEKNRMFGIGKRANLPSKCLECDVLHMCHGGCPKHRFCLTETGDRNLNYLCKGYKMFFEHLTNAFRK